MNNNFTYCVLTYTHSQFLNERVNVGILFHFENTNQFIFKFPKKFTRIKDLYGDFSEWQLRSNLIAIEEKTYELNVNERDLFGVEKFDSLEEQISKKILRPDSTVLSFLELKYSTNIEKDINTIVRNYYSLYFSEYKEDLIILEKHDEPYISNTFRHKLQTKKPGVQNLLSRDVEVKATDTDIVFNYKWKNGVDNFVYAVGFDLETDVSIDKKAVGLWGRLNLIKEALNGNKVDLLISTPSIKNKNLKEAYKKGINLLGKSDVKPTIYEENDIEKYVEIVAKEIHAPIHD